MKPHARRDAEAGFSLIELTVTMGVMVAILGITAGLMADALRSATVVSETTDAQQSLRSAHEYLNRDLVVAGDGLGGLGTSKVMLPRGFFTANISPAPTDPRTMTRGTSTYPYVALPIINSDDAQSRSAAVAGLLAGADRLTLMTIQSDPSFPVSIVGGTASYSKPNANTLIANVPSAVAALFRPGEVVLVSSAAAGGLPTSTFAAVSGVTTGAGAQLRFATGDPYGLNTADLPLLTEVVCGANTPGGLTNCNGVTVQRVLLITYFVDSNGLLRRRVLGKPRRGTITDADFAAGAMAGDVVAEHVTEFEARFGIVASDRTGWDIMDQMNMDQEPRVRQVEVKLTAETPHPIKKDGEHATATSVVRTSVRTMEYRNAL